MARIVKERLEQITDRILPESQCGFRKGRGCVDMIFVTRQLVEKTREHNDTLYMLFVDLKKGLLFCGKRSIVENHGEVWRSTKDAENCEVISQGNACRGEGWFSNN